MKSIIKVEQLQIVYNRKKIAVENVSFEVREGEVFGILGPNGAGKTSLIKAMSTMLLPTKGKITVFDLETEGHSNKIRSQINFVYGGEQGFYPRLTSKQYLLYFCSLYGIKHQKADDLITKLLKEVKLEESKDLEIFKYSKGMKQRLHLARALINNPKILFLDEPTVGLDPEGVSSLRNLISKISRRGMTVVLCTHNIMEAQELCDRVAFFSEGKISSIETPRKIIENTKKEVIKFQLVCDKGDSKYFGHRFLSNCSHKIIKNSGYYVFEYFSKLDSYESLKKIVKRSDIGLVNQIDMGLEDAYLYYYKELEVYDNETDYE